MKNLFSNIFDAIKLFVLGYLLYVTYPIYKPYLDALIIKAQNMELNTPVAGTPNISTIPVFNLGNIETLSELATTEQNIIRNIDTVVPVKKNWLMEQTIAENFSLDACRARIVRSYCFKVKAGIDLKQITIDSTGRNISINLPAAEILSLDLISISNLTADVDDGDVPVITTNVFYNRRFLKDSQEQQIYLNVKESVKKQCSKLLERAGLNARSQLKYIISLNNPNYFVKIK